MSSTSGSRLPRKPTEAEIREESRKTRRLQFLVHLVMSVIDQTDFLYQP